MALQGWRLFGVSATIIIYIGGVILLSMNNVPGSHPKRVRIERFAELSDFGNSKFGGSKRKMTIRWCKEPTYLTAELPNTLINYNSEYITPTIYDADTRNFPNRVVALASFPGSGNTWLRYLLQQATGFLTGSVYKDYGLMKNGFPAESITNSSVLVVKTHEWGAQSWALFSKAILLIRDPEKAILAEFNRQSGGHVGSASPDRYKRAKGKYWQHFVANKLKIWETMNLQWTQNFKGSIKVVFYDDLVNNLEATLKSILEFLDVPVDATLLNCAVLRREGIFRRKKRVISFDPFTSAMRKQIHARREILYKTLGRTH